MTAQVRSELLKLRTTRTTAQLLAGAVALTVLAVLLEGLPPSAVELAREHTQREVFSAVTSAPLFATLAGLIAVTSEFRYNTIRPTLLVQPRRRVVVAAKLATAALTGAVLGAACVVVAFASGLVLLAARGVDLQLTGTHLIGLVVGPVVAGALGAAIGSAVGLLIRNQAGAIIAVLAYAFMVDAGLFEAAPSLGRFLPGKAGDALIGLPRDGLVAPAAGAAVLLAWAVAFAVAAALRTERMDV